MATISYEVATNMDVAPSILKLGLDAQWDGACHALQGPLSLSLD
jgi:hypothetical protein